MSESQPERDAIFLGIDGGGTSTDAWLAKSGGDVIGRGTAGPSNAKAVGALAAREAIDTAIRLAFESANRERVGVDVACLGLAGFDRPDDKAVLGDWAEQGQWARQLVLVNDGDLVVAAGTRDGWGIGVIAGTGSIAVGRAPDGRTARAGGWGHLLGDEGSAYGVVLDALRLVARRADGREPRPDNGDPLTERMCAALGVKSAQQIVSAIYAPDVTRARIAALAPAVLAACAEAPLNAEIILLPAGRALADTVAAVARALGWQSGPLPLAAAGSFLLSAENVRQEMTRALSARGYDVMLTPVKEPARGALILAEAALMFDRHREKNQTE